MILHIRIIYINKNMTYYSVILHVVGLSNINRNASANNEVNKLIDQCIETEIGGNYE